MWTFCQECHSRRDAGVPYCEACGAQLTASSRVAVPERLKGHSLAIAIGLFVAVIQAVLRHVI